MIRQNNNALLFIFITVLVDVIGLGIIIPIVPKLIENLTGHGISEASKYGGWLLFSYAIMQFLFSPILGGLSDRFGRRPILLLSLFGLGLDYIFHAFAPSIAWLFVGRIIAGIMGASFSTATAYIADISTPEKRAQNFGLIGAAFGLGFIIGPVIGGISSKWGTNVPFLIAAGLTLLNVIYGYFVLPESLSKDHRRAFEWKRANPISSLRNLKKYPVVSGLVVSLVLTFIASHAVQSNWSFYTIYKFNWTAEIVGYSLAVVGVLVAFVQGFLIRKIIPRLGQTKSIYLGMSFSAIGLLLFGLATESWMMFVFLIPYCLGGIAGPSIQGVISSQVPANEQGELQGALTSLMSLCGVFGPLLMTNLFAFATVKNGPIYLPGAPFFLASCLTLISFYLSYRTLSNKR
ncbi:MFS transporter, DHA1 family, tetracycline resistance protein [Flavobacterium succinicans]|uniref:MFS transporter, DHA1 family, tetracycline resistance protein n=1 Tax=Flavobacterium succinicans TaxID=29536 RepID=A0A1I4UB44_9FLAO|nr:tetracycline resistance MFS efflux pump [Flavobacterium succinicans]SFM86051.1 MFS transporter, DHA1 family, tetracycline resistance protein [Flavobacterium succinicans]